ncbi:MAG: bile acid:sodium symporter family protein [Desulfobacterales bacterium]|nr:bile acid:sodium symporter family protein [Desulfobacterales bacterium]
MLVIKSGIGIWFLGAAAFLLSVALFLCGPPLAIAEGQDGAALYRRLSQVASGQGDLALFAKLNAGARQLDWSRAQEKSFAGHLRIIRAQGAVENPDHQVIYLLRELTGAVHILEMPENAADLGEGSGSPYAGLGAKFENKLEIRALLMPGTIGGVDYRFARLVDAPVQPGLDRIFRIAIILMLFFVMIGMGLTLTFKDFALVFTKPRGIILGQLLQFGFMPFLAMAMGHLLGFYQQYPFIFVGMILITAIPGGVTSNLMTYYAKGDLALSISLTSFSTVLSILFTPLLLALYCANMPEVNIPVKTVVQTIMVLVIIPLIAGMSIRGRWSRFAEKATPFFSALGIVALLALIIAGVWSNLHVFTDTDRYGVKFYTTVFALTFLGMVSGIVFSKMIGINNYQTRAISLETGLRNSALAMTIALLIQDAMGDFYSSMFVTSGLFGLIMYVAGIIAIFMYKPLLPLEKSEVKGQAADRPG